jgi:hypothetical protein
MKKISLFLALVLVAALALPAAAEVEEITVGGSVQVRGQYLTPGFQRIVTVIPPFSFVTFEGFNDDIEDEYWVTQRTLVNVDARLTGNVRAFAEIQAFDFWGLDGDDVDLEAASFNMSDPILTAGFAGQGNDILELYQGYIELDNIADTPLMLRVGRQELVYGREWLIGNNNDGVNFSGLAFDAVKLGYVADTFKVDAWWSQLANFANPTTVLSFGQSEDASIDFFGVYGTYTGFENTALDAYFLWVRDNTEFAGDDNDNLYTVGARLAGCWDMMGYVPGLLDYNVEGAYQFGDTAQGGSYSAWAFNALGGYTFDKVTWSPRVEAEYAFFSGDEGDIEDEDIDQFNRLFSDVHYGEMNLGGNLDANATNMHVFRVGASAVPVERWTLAADLYYFLLDEAENTVFGAFNTSDDDNVGWELDLVADYQYTEDLNLRAGWALFFPDDAIENSWGGDDQTNYLYVQAALVF